MAYTNVAALQSRLGDRLYARLTDRVAGVTADSTVAQLVLDESEAEINGILARRYVVPVDVGGNPALAALLAARTLDGAEYRVWRTSPFTSELPGRVRALHGQLRDWLDALADGRIELAAVRTAEDSPRHSSVARKLTHDELNDW